MNNQCKTCNGNGYVISYIAIPISGNKAEMRPTRVQCGNCKKDN